MAQARAEYLKRYLVGGDGGAAGGDKKRRKKKPAAAGAGAVASGIRVHDDDVNDWRTRQPGDYRGGDEDDEEDAVVVEATAAAAERSRPRGAVAGGSWVTLEAPGGGGVDAGDLSPPRRGRHDSPVRRSSAAQRKRRNPMRETPLASLFCVSFAQEASPVRRGRHDSSPDMSPPRRPAAGAAGGDLSPPRRRAPQPAADVSPPRRGRHDSSPDISPPRRGAAEPPARGGPAADLSPPRRGRAPSPPDSSPPRRPAAGGAGADLSPPRRRPAAAADAGDISPPRRGMAGAAIMTDGSRAGLVSGADVMAEARAKRAREAERLAALGDDAAGRGATTVYRDKSGRALEGAEAAAAAAAEAAASRPGAKPPAERPAWGGGIAQVRNAEAARAAVVAAASQPFARFADDAALDAERKRASRWGDPLAGLVPASGTSEAPPPPVPGGDAAWLEKAGFKIPTEVPAHSWIKRRLGAPPNRYNIRPGRHWDGVDRSNGSEVQFVKVKADAATREQQAWTFVQSAYE
jgi:pre-mRNA-splicing factor CWC26